ncbi:MAG: amino acid ABC transporter permease [Candidatus Limnocylindria bacterium]
MTAQALPAPSSSIGPIAWLHRNLFSGPLNSIFTVLLGAAIVWVTLQVGAWAATEARWSVVTDNLRIFLIGRYPAEQAWRIWLSLAMLSVLCGASAGSLGRTARILAVTLSSFQVLLAILIAVSPIGLLGTVAYAGNATAVWIGYVVGLRGWIRRRALTLAWLVSLPVTFILIAGLADTPVASVGSNLWGGLLLTVVLAAVGIVLSFPFGVLLALGRRSRLPVVRVLSIAYIELIRGVPLVTILFMADLILPVFLPAEWRLDRVARAMGGITLFSAAYVAENVRGGLQAIPTGQVEAAQALGLSGVQTNVSIVLPQALRAVIPANVGLFISLLKDTTLVTIIGLLEILGIGRAVLAQSESLGARMEVYAFVAAVFFFLCYAMSQASYRIERALGVGTR